MGMAGLGAAGLSALTGGQAFADMEKKGRYVIVITNGGNDPDRVVFALLMGTSWICRKGCRGLADEEHSGCLGTLAIGDAEALSLGSVGAD